MQSVLKCIGSVSRGIPHARSQRVSVVRGGRTGRGWKAFCSSSSVGKARPWSCLAAASVWGEHKIARLFSARAGGSWKMSLTADILWRMRGRRSRPAATEC